MKLAKTFIALMAAAVCAASADAARVNKFGIDTEVCDPVLIYTGGLAKRATWNKTNLLPYVTHLYADGHRDWFYDAFIFNEITWYSGEGHEMRALINTLGATPATQSDWNEFLDHIFAENSDMGALDKLIGEQKATLGEPRMRHKVIVGLCSPCMNRSYRVPDGGDTGFQWTKYRWGTVDGVDMDFSKREHRIAAQNWYIDEVIRRFKEKNYENIELAGFYCANESMNPRVSTGDIMADVNDYIHQVGYRSYWIPYWYGNDEYATVWKDKYHFDMAYRQPNYFFYNSDGTLPPESQLTQCITNSKLYGLGLELEFETTDKSNGLHEVSEAMHNRLIKYIDEFESRGVWDNAGVAHYGGSQGYIHMANSSDPVNLATIDRLADIVARRQRAFAENGSVSAITPENRQFAYPGVGEIFVPADCPEVVIYDMAGIELHRGTGRFSCCPGVYLAADGAGHSVKVVVK